MAVDIQTAYDQFTQFEDFPHFMHRVEKVEQQDATIRGEPTAIETEMHRLARHRWQTRQNPRSFRHGGRELRCFRLIGLEQPNHTRIQRFIPLPPALLRRLTNYPG